MFTSYSLNCQCMRTIPKLLIFFLNLVSSNFVRIVTFYAFDMELLSTLFLDLCFLAHCVFAGWSVRIAHVTSNSCTLLSGEFLWVSGSSSKGLLLLALWIRMHALDALIVRSLKLNSFRILKKKIVRWMSVSCRLLWLMISVTWKNCLYFSLFSFFQFHCTSD